MNLRLLGYRFLIVSSLLCGAAFTYAIPEHFHETDWPEHAKNHAFESILWVIGLSLSVIYIAADVYKNRKKQGIYLLSLIGVLIYPGYFWAGWITGGPAPGLFDDIVFAVLGIFHFSGVALLAKKSVEV